MRGVVVICALAIVVAACSAGATAVPAGGGGSGAPASAAQGASGNGSASVNPSAVPAASSAAASSAGGGGDLGGVDVAGLASIASEKVCGLLSKDEAGAILGDTITAAPSGMLLTGLGTNCIYNGASAAAPSIKIEFNTLGYGAQVEIIKLTGSVQALTIAGRPASGVEAPSDPTSLVKAQLEVSLADDPKAVALYVEAPTLAKAQAVAEKVVPRIAGLK